MLQKVKGQILYLFNENQGLVYRNLSFYIIDLRNYRLQYVTRFHVGRLKKMLCSCRWTNRLLRMEPKCVGVLPGNEFLISIFDGLWVLNTNEGIIKKVQDVRDGFSQVLNFCEYGSNIYWGDYGVNSKRDAVNIYKMDSTHNIESIHQFAAGSVRHIHNVINDTENDCFWVLVGDNEPMAGIYKANRDWSEVRPYKTGLLKYRAVVGFAHKGGLIYATDSVEHDNYLRFIDNDGTEKVVADINGSCIYGCETKDYYIFSTTVEPHEGSGFLHKFENRLGGGIKSWYVHVIAVSKKDLSVRIVKKLRKDWLPMVLFQYGRVKFAGGQCNNADYVWGTPVACCKHDGKTIKIEF